MRSDRWSSMSEIKKVLNRSEVSAPGGPVLCHNNGQNWLYTNEGHLIFLGVSGSGKSRRGTIPMVKSFIEAGESFIVVDPKGEIHYQTAADAEGKYTIHVIDFRHIFESERWNPLSAPYEHFISGDPVRKQIALEMIDELAHTMYTVSDKADPFWPESARSVFIGAVYALMTLGTPEQVNMASVYQLIARGEERFGGSTILKEAVNSLPNDSVASMMLQSYVTTANDTRAGIRSVFLEGLSMFARSDGLISMLGGDDLHINNLDGATPTAIYIILPDESPIFDSISGVLCSQLMGHYVRLAQDKYNGKLPCRLNVCLEELGNIGKSISSLAHLMSAGRSRNIRCQLVLQSLSQLDTLYGTSEASTIRANADVLVVFRTNHWETLTELSHKCGEREVESNHHVSRENLITPSQLAAMKTGQALVMISGHMKFITWLPDFTEMFDCSSWKMPKRGIRKSDMPTSVFDIKSYVQDLKKKHFATRGIQDSAQNCHGVKDLPVFPGSMNSLTTNPFECFSMPFESMRDSEEDKSGFDVDSLIAKIDAKIAALETEEEEEKKAKKKRGCAITLIAINGAKSKVIKAILNNNNMSLKQAKVAVDSMPYTFNFKTEKATNKAMKEISEVGGIVVPGMLEPDKE